MKQFFNICLVFLFVFAVAACGTKTENGAEATAEQEGTPEEHHDEAGHDGHNHDGEGHDDATSDEAAAASADFSSISDEKAKAVVNAYLELKDALVATDASKAKDASKKMLTSLDGLEATPAVGGLKEDAQHIVDTDEMEHMREHFDLMSQDVYALAKTKNTGMTLYKQYCPMAFNDQGAYWLSSNEEIRNPYFGDKMLKCGKVQETIAVN